MSSGGGTSTQVVTPQIPQQALDAIYGALNQGQQQYGTGNFQQIPFNPITATNYTAQGYTPIQFSNPSYTTAINAQGVDPVTAQQVAAKRGSEFMNEYLNPYTKDVVDTSLADYDVGTDRSFAANQAARDAGSAFGGRAALSDALLQSEFARGRGSLSAGLRSNAFNTAAGYGQSDASRFLQGDIANQGASLQAAIANATLGQNLNIANAGYANQANQFNTGISNATNMFNVGNVNNALAYNSGVSNAAGMFNAQQGQQANMFNTTGQYGAGVGNRDYGLNAFNTFITNPLNALAGTYGNSSTTRTPGSINNTIGSLGSAAGGAGALLYGLSLFCWVAREVYGTQENTWKKFRTWLFTKAPKWLFNLYLKHGEKFAQYISTRPRMKAFVKSLMDEVVYAN